MTFLAVDVGNSNIVIGLFENETLVDHWRSETALGDLSDTWRTALEQWIGGRSVTAAGIACVVPRLKSSLTRACQEVIRVDPLEINATLQTGVTVLYADPRALGADRVANVAAAYARWGGPTIVVDAGTATKFEAVTPDGRYPGGAIAPGMRISADALFRKTAALPEAPLEAPTLPIGRSTVECIQSGVTYGFVGLVEGLVERFREAMGAPSATVVATGGLSELIARHTDCFDHHEPFLTLDGIRIIYDLNR